MGFKNCFHKFFRSTLSYALVFRSFSKCSVLSRFIGCLAPLLIPPFHILILYYFWHQFSRRVDRRYCSCSCWDTVFKGSYESSIASYKHIYFNATYNTFKMWALTVICMITFYESIRRMVTLAIRKVLRFTMLLLFLSQIFSHYYSWWIYVNYWNDDFYDQWYHQLFFTSTELLSTAVVLKLADRRVMVSPRKSFFIFSIAAIHVIAGSWDQFVLNVIKRKGYSHQVVRDVCFMIPDILHLLIPPLELWRSYKNPLMGSSLRDLGKEFILSMSLISFGLLLCSHL